MLVLSFPKIRQVSASLAARFAGSRHESIRRKSRFGFAREAYRRGERLIGGAFVTLQGHGVFEISLLLFGHSQGKLMIDPLSENLITLAEAARLCPRRRRGRPVHVSSIYRWSTNGCRGVRLETIQIGATRCTSHEALRRFFQILTADAAGDEVVGAAPSSNCDDDHSQANAYCEREGL